MKILMVASENDAIPGGKVGGIGDVVRDVPVALADAGQLVDIVLPSYGAFSQLPGSQLMRTLEVEFKGISQTIGVYQVSLVGSHKNITQWVLEHPLFAAGGVGQIYCDDPNDGPFATDASKFALFSAAVAQAIITDTFGTVDVLHLHDWHSATLAVLRLYDPRFVKLKSIHTVYTIHNLALQGIRPLAGDDSSLTRWFGDFNWPLEQIKDPRYQDCFNPMRAGINLCDRVHTVSVNYAREILLPSNTEKGYFGGEGLEDDLCRAAQTGRLHGIINGCDYSQTPEVRLPLNKLVAFFEQTLLSWIGAKPTVQSAHLIAMTRLARLSFDATDPPLLVTSVGRLTTQKVLLLQQDMGNGLTALDQLLIAMGERGLLVMLGSGDSDLEQFMTEVAAKHTNFIFLKGYSPLIAQNLYASGDLFLMPSSFEPCGISQMLAMREGQPCLVHNVGGLSDTVSHLKNGFTFDGDTPIQQAQNMIDGFQQAWRVKVGKPKQWQKIATNSAQSRFLWSDVAKRYISHLYDKSGGTTKH